MKNIENFCNKLQSSFIKNYVVNGKNMDLYRITLFNISSHYENNVLSYLNVKVTPEAYKFFNNIHKNFLVGFSLKEFSFITTKSAKNLYRIIKEIECRHFKYLDIDSFVFQNLMDIQKSHSSVSSEIFALLIFFDYNPLTIDKGEALFSAPRTALSLVQIL